MTTAARPPAGRPLGPPDLLDAALRRDPARPLLTFYDDATDERTELSVATFANWVAKTANLLRDDLAVEPGARMAVDLPPHWQAAVLLQAGWALGLHTVPAGAPADVTVVGYDGSVPAAAGDVVALGLGPMGLPRRDAPAPPGTTLDYDREVHGHGDRFVPEAPADPAAPALTSEGVTRTGADLAELAAGADCAPGARLLVVQPLATVTAVLAGVLVPLASDVTAVVCRNLRPERLADRVAQEGIVAAVGGVPGPAGVDLPEWHP